jgi:hypothetical protein
MSVSDTAPRQSAASQLPITPSQIEGPHFRPGAPRRESLIEPDISGPLGTAGPGGSEVRD